MAPGGRTLFLGVHRSLSIPWPQKKEVKLEPFEAVGERSVMLHLLHAGLRSLYLRRREAGPRSSPSLSLGPQQRERAVDVQVDSDTALS